MPDYTFHTLSPIDFENMVRDLLQAELSIRLESFKVGKDLGIDLRYSECGVPSLIVQAKHYADTGFRGLLSHLRLGEKPKIDRLHPTRYLLATSVALSPANKDTIRKALSPHIKGTEDIYGKHDLNNLLGLFPAIERQHFKLWLSSTPILEEVLHSRLLNQTRIALEDIRDRAKFYVSNESFNKALQVLKNYNYVIIAGIPGIGKTTLAKMLVLHFLRADYDFMDVSYDISEAYSIPDHKRPRVYLYDDFLGRTALAERLRKNEYHRLLDFVASIRKTKSAKLILTTREYILRQAQTTYEVLNNPAFDKPQCIVDLSQYTRPIRAQILYNHLYFSQLSKEYVQEIVRQGTYLEILDHPNYNPRIVEYMTDPLWVGSARAEEYPSIFLRNLQEPFLIWEQAFNNHLSPTAREILLVLGSMPSDVFVADLERAAKAFLPKQGVQFSSREFCRALSELQGNFIVLKRDRENDIVAFHNPSIQDFVENYFHKNPRLYASLFELACFFEQFQWGCERLAKSGRVREFEGEMKAAVEHTLSAPPCRLINYSLDRGQSRYKDHEWMRPAARLSFVSSLIGRSGFTFLGDFLRNELNKLTTQIAQLKLENRDLFELGAHVLRLEGIDDLRDAFFAAMKESLFQNSYWLSDVKFITQLMEVRPQLFTPEDRRLIVETVKDIVDNHLDDDDPQLLSDELSALEDMERQCGFGLEQQTNRVRHLLASAEENCPPEGDYDEDSYRRSSDERWISNDALADMFSTLLG